MTISNQQVEQVAPMFDDGIRESDKSTRRLRVLLAEDNPINQKLAKLQLQKLGFEVNVAVNGQDALDAIDAVGFDLIFMDCEMPELDGYEATRELRRREGGLRHTTVVAMTAHTLPSDREKCLAAGMDAYVSKPVMLQALTAVLGELFPTLPSNPAQPSASAKTGAATDSSPAPNPFIR